MNYYNEFDPNAAEWIRQLIAMDKRTGPSNWIGMFAVAEAVVR